MFSLWHNFLNVMHQGGVVMWPLLVVSAVAVVIIIERGWFFISVNSPSNLDRLEKIKRLLRHGQLDEARNLVKNRGDIYGRAAAMLLDGPLNEALAVDAVEAQRHTLEKFLPTLSTIITAAPMLGILGTVLGIISSFQILSTQVASGDPKAISMGIAEALITTAAGLLVALVALFPYNAFRAQIDRTLSRLESVAAAALGSEVEKDE